jgi:hypothetical protein
LGQSPLGTCPESDGQQTTYLPDSQNCEYEWNYFKEIEIFRKIKFDSFEKVVLHLFWWYSMAAVVFTWTALEQSREYVRLSRER